MSHRQSYFDPSGRPVIVMGWEHLGCCPTWQRSIIEFSFSREHKTAKCARGHTFLNPTVLRDADALKPTIDSRLSHRPAVGKDPGSA